jgi:hypothetical protein
MSRTQKYKDKLSEILNTDFKSLIDSTVNIAEQEYKDKELNGEFFFSEGQSLLRRKIVHNGPSIFRTNPTLVKGKIAVIHIKTGIRQIIQTELFDETEYIRAIIKRYYFNGQHKITKQYRNIHIFDLNNDNFNIDDYDIIDVEKYQLLLETYKDQLKKR